MSASFTPDFKGYTGQGAFRFWCQTALPLIYDDSLSYYELLNKMVVYLNNVISDVGNMEDNINALLSAYNQLQDYVNTYFDNLDVQEEINHKLDEMAEGGTLSSLIAPFVADGLPSVVGDQIDAVVASQIDGSVGSQIDESVASQIATPVATNVTSWLNENVTPVGSAVVVDESLSISGAAADAKVTGDKITELNSAINGAFENTISGSFTEAVTSTIVPYSIIKGVTYTITMSAATSVRLVAFINYDDENDQVVINETSTGKTASFVATGNGGVLRFTTEGAANYQVTTADAIIPMENRISLTEKSVLDAFEVTHTGNTTYYFAFSQGSEYTLDAISTNNSIIRIVAYTKDASNNMVDMVMNDYGKAFHKSFIATGDAVSLRIESDGTYRVSVYKENTVDGNYKKIRSVEKEIGKTSVSESIATKMTSLTKDVFLPFRKGDFCNLEIEKTADANISDFRLEIYAILPDGSQSSMLCNPFLSILDNRIFPFICQQDAIGYRFKYTNVTSITSEHPLQMVIKITKSPGQVGLIGHVESTKAVTLFTDSWTAPHFAIIYNDSNDYGSECLARWIRDAANNQLWTAKTYTVRANDRVVVELIKSPETAYNKYLLLTNTNSLSLKYDLVTKDYYFSHYGMIPFNFSYLGYGRSIISPSYSEYCHNAYCICDKEYTYAIYHSKDKRSIEGWDTPENNVYLTIIKEGNEIVNTFSIFSDREYYESYNSETLKITYNHSCVKFGRNIVIKCGFKTETTHIWMYKTFDLDTWELSGIKPLQLSYGGNSYDWTIANYIDMVNSLYSTSFDDTYLPDHVEISGMFAYNNKIYTVFAGNIATDNSTPSPHVLMESTDGETWSPIANINNDTRGETAIAISNNKLLCLFRTTSAVKYGVYSLTGEVLKQPETISNVLSKPCAFVYNGNIYAIYNITSDVITDDVYYKRYCISISALDSDNDLNTLKTYLSEAGFQYFDVGVYGHRVRFINTEDNGGINLPESTGTQYGYGPYCQLSICGIKLEDLVISS